MDWSKHEELSKVWTQATKMYVAALAKRLRKARTYGPDKAGPEPQDPREGLGEAVIEVVREANEEGAAAGLRERFPPAHGPFIELLDAQAQLIRNVVAIDEQRVVGAIGKFWKSEGVFLFEPESATQLEGVLAVARCPKHEHFALVRENRVDVHKGWMGSVVNSWPLPQGNEGISPTIAAPAAENVYVIDVQLFEGAQAALVVTPEGVFQTSAEGVVRLFPSREGTLEAVEGAVEDGDEELAFHFDMIHAAIHPGGELVAVGAQSSQHELVDLQGKRVAQFGPVHSEYPHHAAFDASGEYLLVNSCHMYNGATMVGAVEALRGLMLDPYDEDERLRLVDEYCRVYASVACPDYVVLGEAWGYLRAKGLDGKEVWDHHVGSTIGGMDLSPSGKHLFVGTAAGFLHAIELDTGVASELQIGTSTNRELRRYVCWRGEEIWLW